MMYAPLPFRIWLDRRFAFAEDDVIPAGRQEHHLEVRCIEDLLQAEHLGIKPAAGFEIAHRDAEMHHAPGFYRSHCRTVMLIHSAIYQRPGDCTACSC